MFESGNDNTAFKFVLINAYKAGSHRQVETILLITINK